MNSANDQTLASYNAHVDEYIQGTPQDAGDDVKAWIDENLAALTPNARILELGSAFGRDADYMEARGFMVERTDASEGFVKLLRTQGHSARLLNAIRDEWGDDYNMVFANAVLLHFNREEATHVVRKAFEALQPGGRFVFSLKQGDGDEISMQKLGAPRYFCYWRFEDIEQVLHGAGFSIVECRETDDYRPDKPAWLLITAIKKVSA